MYINVKSRSFKKRKKLLYFEIKEQMNKWTNIIPINIEIM